MEQRSPVNARGTDTAQSLDRVFRIIETLSDHPRGLGLTELARLVSLPKATTSRMLNSLIRNGYCVQEPDTKKYRLTIRLFEIGSRVAGGVNILSVARPYLEALSQSTGEAVHLVCRTDDEIIYLYKEEPQISIVRMSSFVGLRSPMYCTGVGKSILAHLGDAELAEYFARITPVPFTEHTITTYPALLSEMHAIRERGYAIDNEEHELGVRCIAVPILDFSARPIAAISISASAKRMDEATIRAYAPMIRETAQSIERFYGGDRAK